MSLDTDSRLLFNIARDPDSAVHLSAAFTDKTKVVIINTPHNPSGKVFSREELTAIAEICTKHDVLVLADEVVSLASLTRGYRDLGLKLAGITTIVRLSDL